MTVGETKQFNCKMPATWLEPESKDTDLIYEITVLEVLSWELPEASPAPPPSPLLPCAETCIPPQGPPPMQERQSL